MLQYVPLVGSALLTIIILGFIVYWVYQSRRKIGIALAGPVRSLCCHAEISNIVWTADGWVATCHSCGAWQYFGDHEYEPGKIKSCGAPVFDMRPLLPGEKIIPMDSRRQAPRPAATEPAGEGQLAGRLEVTSMKSRAMAHIARAFGEEGEPLAVPPPPNLGGEGSPDYQGPHYRVQHDRFVPYDVLRDPVPGAAVHIVGPVACVGPLEDEGDRGDATLDISRADEDEQ